MSYQEYRVNIANPSVRRASDKADAILNNFDNTGFAPVSRSLNRVEYNIIGSLGVTHRTVAQRNGERVTASCTCSATRICYHGLMAVKMLPRIVRTVTIDNSREAIIARGRIMSESRATKAENERLAKARKEQDKRNQQNAKAIRDSK